MKTAAEVCVAAAGSFRQEHREAGPVLAWWFGRVPETGMSK